MAISTEAFYALSHEQKREYMNRVVAERDAEIAKLRAELDEAKRTLVSLFDDTKAEMTRLRSALAAARAALNVEREACDAWRASWNVGGYESLKAAEEYHDQRRAAEAKGEQK